MNDFGYLVFISHDTGLLNHWKSCFGSHHTTFLTQLSALPSTELPSPTTLWLDTALPGLPAWGESFWSAQLQRSRIVCASSYPKDAQAIAALDTGCSAYCQAFAPADSLQQIQKAVAAGQVWVGHTLMQKLLANAHQAASQRPAPPDNWGAMLTGREREVAILVAQGASNKAIASACNISERTVKAHLTAIFEKMHLEDRLQLALRVHGIG